MLLVLKAALGKAWAWWKKWWRWVVFPVGIAGFLLAGRRVVDELYSPEDDYPSDDKTILDIRNALVERDEKLEELKAQHGERLRQMGEAQQAELEQLESKSTEEVVAWFDKLSSS